jgi:PAS domain S-box-containing protein
MTEPALPTDGSGIDGRLVESEARYRAVIENASDMIQSCRPDGSFEFVNRTWLEKMGYTADEVSRMVVWDVIHPESLDHCADLFRRAVEGETIEHVRATFVTKDGQAVPVEGNATSRFVDGEVIATHSFFRDITERLRAEELEERNAQLERDQLARYLEKMAALGKLAAGLAHELNNPAAAAQRAGAQLTESIARRDAALTELHRLGLSSAQWDAIDRFIAASNRPPSGERRPVEVSRLEDEMEDWLASHQVLGGWELASALVQEGIAPERLESLAAEVPPEALAHVLTWLAESSTARELAGVVARSSQRISELVTAIKAYSYMDRAAEQVIDVHEGIENTLVILAHRLRDATIVREFDRSLPPVRAFGSGLNQVWTNLLDNASDAIGEEDGTITVRTRGEDGRVLVEIEDNGCGIEAEHLPRIFEPFFSTKAQGEGTGLGLDTAWRIVTEEHHGTITVESEPGRTVFRVSLPAAEPAAHG